MHKSVSVVIPVLNEESYIRNCLLSVQAFTVPDEWNVAEVLVLDGGSYDSTVELVATERISNSKIVLIPNPGKIQSTALNIALRNAVGDFILRLDAHAVYPVDYLAKCIQVWVSTRADNVGGIFLTMPGNDTYGAQLVQALTTSRFGVGNAGFRLGEGAGKADTVPYGFFRKDLFSKVGMFDERLVRAQDYEMNRRISAYGGVVWRDPVIKVQYFNQPSISAFLKKQLFKEAPYNAYLWYLAPYAFAWRHAITGVFALGVISGIVVWPWLFARNLYLVILSIYAILAILSGLQQSITYREWRHAFLLPLCFFSYHFIHGIGVVVGLVTLLLCRAPVQRIPEPWPGAGQFRAWPPPDNRSWQMNMGIVRP